MWWNPLESKRIEVVYNVITCGILMLLKVDNFCVVCEHCSVNEIRQSNNPESNRGHYIKTPKMKFGNF
jgi:hypothetical protein